MLSGLYEERKSHDKSMTTQWIRDNPESKERFYEFIDAWLELQADGKALSVNSLLKVIKQEFVSFPKDLGKHAFANWLERKGHVNKES